MRLAARERIPDAARERPKRARQIQMCLGGLIGRCTRQAGRDYGNDGRKAAGNNARQIRAIDRHGMGRRAMDFAAFLAGILGAVIVL